MISERQLRISTTTSLTCFCSSTNTGNQLIRDRVERRPVDPYILFCRFCRCKDQTKDCEVRRLQPAGDREDRLQRYPEIKVGFVKLTFESFCFLLSPYF